MTGNCVEIFLTGFEKIVRVEQDKELRNGQQDEELIILKFDFTPTTARKFRVEFHGSNYSYITITHRYLLLKIIYPNQSFLSKHKTIYQSPAECSTPKNEKGQEISKPQFQG